MSSRREVLLGACGAVTAGVLPLADRDRSTVSYDAAEGVRPLNVTGYGADDEPDVLGVEQLTGFGEIEISTSGDVPTLRVDAESRGGVTLRTEADVSRAELVALRREIDAALSEA